MAPGRCKICCGPQQPAKARIALRVGRRKRLNGTDPKRRDKQRLVDQGLRREVLELVDDSDTRIPYERYSKGVDVSDFEYGLQYKGLCAACPEHEKRFSCPPYSPSFPEHIGKAQRAWVVCVRFPGNTSLALPRTQTTSPVSSRRPAACSQMSCSITGPKGTRSPVRVRVLRVNNAPRKQVCRRVLNRTNKSTAWSLWA